jgi:hypothetical protein
MFGNRNSPHSEGQRQMGDGGGGTGSLWGLSAGPGWVSSKISTPSTKVFCVGHFSPFLMGIIFCLTLLVSTIKQADTMYRAHRFLILHLVTPPAPPALPPPHISHTMTRCTKCTRPQVFFVPLLVLFETGLEQRLRLLAPPTRPAATPAPHPP